MDRAGGFELKVPGYQVDRTKSLTEPLLQGRASRESRSAEAGPEGHDKKGKVVRAQGRIIDR